MKTLKIFFGKTHIKLLCLFIVAMFCAVTVLAFSTPIDAEAEKASPTLVSETETIQASRTITTAAQLVAFANLVNSGSNRSDTVTLGCNIDMSSYSSFTPIGSSSSRSFTGTFNGNGFAITGLTVTGGSYNRGLFGHTDGATIQNLVIASGTIVANAGWSAGAFVGDATNTTLKYCYNFGCTIKTATTGNCTIGGIVGYSTNLNITYCYNSASVTTQTGSAEGTRTIKAGGICGYMASGKIECSTNKGSVIAGSETAKCGYAGGIFGTMADGSINNCSNEGGIYAYAKQQRDTANVNQGKKATNDEDWVENGLTPSYLTTVWKDAYTGGIGGYADKGALYNCINLSTAKHAHSGYKHFYYDLYYTMKNKHGILGQVETDYAIFHGKYMAYAYHNTMIGHTYRKHSVTYSNCGYSTKDVDAGELCSYYSTSSMVPDEGQYLKSGVSHYEVVAGATLQSKSSYIKNIFGQTNGHELRFRFEKSVTYQFVVCSDSGNTIYYHTPLWGETSITTYPQQSINQGVTKSSWSVDGSIWDNSSSRPYIKNFYWSHSGSMPS